MHVETRLALIKNAADAAVLLDKALTKLLDEYDFYLKRYVESGSMTPSEEFELKDLQPSIQELGVTPLHVANRLDDWSRDKTPELSQEGFEVHVLNEFSIHMFSLATFLRRKQIDVDVDHQEIAKAFTTLRQVNRFIK